MNVITVAQPASAKIASNSVVVLTADSQRLAEVKALWRVHSRTLGYFPDGAFTDYAGRGQILIAGPLDALTGYLVYRVSDDRGVIVHLCTAEHARGSGVARALVTELKGLTKGRGLRGIGLSCRVDFAANSIWPKLGFCPIHERAGRSRDGKPLTYWWHDNGLPDLFSLTAATSSGSRVVAAIDANIYFDLVTDREQGDESRALVADWLQSEIELCIADEIYQEINRGEDEEERRRCRERVSLCRILSSTEDHQTNVRKQIIELLGSGRTDQEKSDREHLIKVAAAKAQVFLTRDDELLRNSEEIHRLVGLDVMRPADLIGQIDELRRTAAYEPARLAGSRISLRRGKADEVDGLPARLCATDRGEGLSEFRHKIRAVLAYPDRSDVFLVSDGTEILALVAFHRGAPGILSVAWLRVLPGSLCQTLSRHLVLRAIQTATETGVTWVRIEDPNITPELETALTELSFFRAGGHFVRCVMRAIGTLDELLPRLACLDGSIPAETAAISAEVTRLHSIPAKLAEELERVFWPVKVIGAGIPTFGIAIHPKWAQHFFDEGIARQELFGADPMLALNREHAYYRSPNRCGLQAPARILWYVTKDGDFDGSMAIRACSRLVSIDIGRPKDLYRRYQRLGVYLWQNVYETAKGSIENDLMAIRFMDTEVFQRPVTLAEAKQFGIKANFESPVRIDENIFCKIYQLGLGEPSPMPKK